MRIRKSYLLLLTISVTLSLSVPLLLGGLGQFKLLKRMPWWSLLLLVMIVLISWSFNTLRLCLLAGVMGQRIKFWKGASIVISAEFAGMATPWNVGLPVAYTFFLRDLTLARAAALFAVMIVFDLCFYGFFVPLAAIGLYFEHSTHSAITTVIPVVGLIAAGIVFIWALIRHHRHIIRVLGKFMGHIDWLARRRFRMGRKVVEFIRAFRVLGQMPRLHRLNVFFMTVGLWAPRYLILPVVIWLIGRQVPLAYLFLVQTVLNVGADVILLPGGGGGVGAAYASLMAFYLGPADIAFSLIAWRTFSFYWYLIIGGPVFLYKTGKAAHSILRGERIGARDRE